MLFDVSGLRWEVGGLRFGVLGIGKRREMLADVLRGVWAFCSEGCWALCFPVFGFW